MLWKELQNYMISFVRDTEKHFWQNCRVREVKNTHNNLLLINQCLEKHLAPDKTLSLLFVVRGPKKGIKTCSWTKNQVALVTVFLNIPVCHSPVLPCLLYLGKTWYDLLASHSAFLHGTQIGLWSIYTTCAHDPVHVQLILLWRRKS